MRMHGLVRVAAVAYPLVLATGFGLARGQSSRSGGILRIADPVGPRVLDPHKNGSYQSSGMVLTMIYRGTHRLPRAADPRRQGTLHPHLAESRPMACCFLFPWSRPAYQASSTTAVRIC